MQRAPTATGAQLAYQHRHRHSDLGIRVASTSSALQRRITRGIPLFHNYLRHFEKAEQGAPKARPTRKLPEVVASFAGESTRPGQDFWTHVLGKRSTSLLLRHRSHVRYTRLPHCIA
jgi:hypothetical protein